MFCDTGCKFFFSELESLGARISHTNVMIAGGASVIQKSDFFKIGVRNEEAIRNYAAEAGFQISQSVGS